MDIHQLDAGQHRPDMDEVIAIPRPKPTPAADRQILGLGHRSLLAGLLLQRWGDELADRQHHQAQRQTGLQGGAGQSSQGQAGGAHDDQLTIRN
ncbi:MAG: hypothetical protein U5O69_06470 [Candidatus Competibacteraceae bacterium]|nr:hypothetical protein [Candidatus Competibacteraceae bacterium]